MSDIKEYSCPSCGAYLNYVPGTNETTCEHCGRVVPISILNITTESEK